MNIPNINSIYKKKKSKRRVSITAKFLLGTVIVLLLNLICVFAVTSYQIGTTTESIYQQELENIAAISVDFFTKLNPETDNGYDLKAMISEFEKTYPYRISFIENDRLISAFISYSQFETMRIRSSGWFGNGLQRYYYQIQDLNMMGSSGTVIKIIIAKEIPLISEQMQSVLLYSGIAILLISVPTILLLLALFRRMSRQIEIVSEAAAQIADGNFNEKIDIQSRDEIGDLAVSINHMTEKLQRNEADRDAFLAGVSHELRTPLTTLKANTKGIIDEVIPRNQAKDYLLSNVEEIDRLTMMVNDLILVSGLEQNKFLATDETNLSELLLDVVKQMELVAGQKQITFSCMIEDHLFKSIDKIKMVQVFINVFDNAVNYSPTGSIIFVSAKRDGDKVIINVRDEGCGIEFEDPDIIFKRFFKSSSSSGLGLGMYLSKLIVIAHGGTINAISNTKSGTTIRISL